MPEHYLNVSNLEPPEPLQIILEKLPGLEPGDFLHIQHRRDPVLLFPMLEKLEFSWTSQETTPDHFDIFIWKSNDTAAATAISDVNNT